jgi:hypothetical protein
MDELKKILNDSSLPDAVKQNALTVALQVATPIAYQTTKTAAGGEFLALLLELLKMLLPILLQLLVPKP